jgi:hypothetical protein
LKIYPFIMEGFFISAGACYHYSKSWNALQARVLNNFSSPSSFGHVLWQGTGMKTRSQLDKTRAIIALGITFIRSMVAGLIIYLVKN